MNEQTGIVYLVGGGPGDPGLLTLKGCRCLQDADVVVYDSLVNPALLRFAGPDADLLFVGKRAKKHLMEQSAINALLIQKAQAGLNVVRLKGGDPCLFGRGGEEAESLAAAGIPFEIVPGVSSPTAVAAYAGIPLTHRHYTSSLTIVTGHEFRTKPKYMPEWEKLATSAGTLVFLMGYQTLPKIMANLIENGRPAHTPCAVIQWGTRPEQRTVVGTLEDIEAKVRAAGLVPPTLIVVGEVVTLRDRINWYETKPLFGQRVVVTRPRGQSRPLAELLEFFGAETLFMPTICIESITDSKPLDAVIESVAEYDWLVFTSVNAVDAVFERLGQLGLDARSLHGVKLCAIGPATARALDAFQLKVDLVPESYKAQGILDAFKGTGDVAGKRFLLPRADIAPPLLPLGLKSLGAVPVQVDAYRTVKADPPPEPLLQQLENGEVSFVTFTSSSTAENYVKLLGEKRLARLPESIHYTSIGPTTSATLRELGLRVAVETSEHTVHGLVKAIVDFVAEEGSE